MRSYLIIGMGNFGRAIATELANTNHEVMIVDQDEKNITPLMDMVTDSVIGDAKDELFLKALGIQNFDCIIVAIARLEDSILINMMLSEMETKCVISKARGELHARILKRLGVTRVVRPEFDMGTQLARSMNEDEDEEKVKK